MADPVQTAPAPAPAAPAIAGIAPGSDGNFYYHDAQGNNMGQAQSTGIAPGSDGKYYFHDAKGNALGESPAPAPSMFQQAKQLATNLGKGVLEGAGQTGQSIVNATDAIGNKIGDAVGLPGHASVQDMAGTGPRGQGSAIMNDLTTPKTAGEKVGGGAEGIAEFVLGDEALKTLSMGEKILKIGKLADAYEKASPFAKSAMEAAINTGGSALRSGGVSAAQGMLHGETGGEAAYQGLLTGGVSLGGAAVSMGLRAMEDRMNTPEVYKYAMKVSGDILRNAAADSKAGKPISDSLKNLVIGDESPEGVKQTIQAISQTPQALGQFVTDIAKHVPTVAAKSIIGYAVYKSSLPNVIKESVIMGLGLHEIGSVSKIASNPAATMLAGHAAPVVEQFVPSAVSAAQAGIAALQPTKSSEPETNK